MSDSESDSNGTDNIPETNSESKATFEELVITLAS